MEQTAVIIPVKDGARTIWHCVRSALAAGTGVRVYVLLNGCTDSTAERLLGIPRSVRIVDLGAGAGAYDARRRGYEMAAADGAKRVLFMDADDSLAPGALTAAAMVQADLVQLRVMECVAAGPLILSASPQTPRFNPDAMMRGAMGDCDSFDPAMIGKLYRTELLSPFPDIRYGGFWGEDRLFTAMIATRNPSVALCHAAVYRHRRGGAGQYPLAPGRMEECSAVQSRLADFAAHMGRPDLQDLAHAHLQLLTDYHSRARSFPRSLLLRLRHLLLNL